MSNLRTQSENVENVNDLIIVICRDRILEYTIIRKLWYLHEYGGQIWKTIIRC